MNGGLTLMQFREACAAFKRQRYSRPALAFVADHIEISWGDDHA